MSVERRSLSGSDRPLAVVVAGAACAGALAVLAVLYLAQQMDIMARNVAEPTIAHLAYAGEYYNVFVVGIVGLVTLLAAVLGFIHFTSKRDEVEILRFFADISSSLGKKLAVIMIEFEALIERAAHCREKAATSINAQFEELLGNAGAELPTIEQIAQDLSDEEKRGFEALSVSMTGAILRWNEEYLTILNAPYETVIAEEQIRQVLRREEGTPIDHLLRTIPASLHGAIGLSADRIPDRDKSRGNGHAWEKYAQDPRQLLALLIGTQRQTEAHHMLDAYVAHELAEYPAKSAIDYLGMVIYSPRLVLASPFTHGKVKIRGYHVNVGAAALLTLYEYLPQRSAIGAAFHKIFQSRSKVGDNFLRVAGPEPGQFVRLQFQDYIHRHSASLRGSLILVQTDGGIESYDRHRHGRIPQDAALYRDLHP